MHVMFDNPAVDDRAILTPIKPGLPRFIEMTAALLGLVGCLPLLVAAGVAIALSSSGAVLFRQNRMGRGGREFVLYKLRTMRVQTPNGKALQVTANDDLRVTPIGKLLRKTKLDELPELWNVVRGDMSLVGPRPEVPRYVDVRDPVWRQVLQARPGITDPVTLRLRNEEALLAMVAGDREQFYLCSLQPFKLKGYATYLRERSWRSDLKVIWKTIVAVVRPHRTPPPTLEEITGCIY